jgi:negative regulator of replication initiation
MAIGHMISHRDTPADTTSEDNSATAVNTLSSSVAAVVIQELKRTTLAQTHCTSNSGVVTTTSSSYHADQYLSVHELLPHLTTVTAHLTTSSSTTTSLLYSDYITVHGTVTSDMMTAQASDVLQYLLTLAVAAQHNASALKHSTTADDHCVGDATAPVVTLVQTAIYDVLRQHYSMRPIPVLIALASGSHLTSTTATTSTDIDSGIDSSVSDAPIVAASALTTALTYIQAVAAACNAGNSSSSSSALHETAVTVQTLLTDVTAAIPLVLTLLGSSYKVINRYIHNLECIHAYTTNQFSDVFLLY